MHSPSEPRDIGHEAARLFGELESLTIDWLELMHPDHKPTDADLYAHYLRARRVIAEVEAMHQMMQEAS